MKLELFWNELNWRELKHKDFDEDDVFYLERGHSKMMALQINRDGVPFVSYYRACLLVEDEIGYDVIPTVRYELLRTIGLSIDQRTSRMTLLVEETGVNK